MSIYQNASNLKSQLTNIINEAIENHPLVKSAIKAKKATVDSVNTTAKTVTVRFPFDTTLVTLPYNPQMESYLTTGTVKGKAVSVWFYQSLQNGIVMQDGSWSISEGDTNIVDMVYPIGSIYMSVNDINPQTLFGGIWEKIEGRFLLGSSSSYENGSSGGSADATVVQHRGHILHTEAVGTPSGENTYYARHEGESFAQYLDNRPYVVRSGNELVLRDFEEGESGVGKNMPPYIAVNIWKRTA